MPETNGENVAPKSSDNKTRFPVFGTILRFIHEVSVPAFLVFFAWIFNQSLGNQSAELQKSLAKQSAELQESLAKQSTEVQESLARQSAELQRATTQQSIAKDYVGIAVSILERPKEENNALRDWAVKLLSQNSPLAFTQQQLAELKSGGLGLLSNPESLRTISVSPDRKQIALLRVEPPGHHIVEVYDCHISEKIFRFDAGVTVFGFTMFVWSNDGSRLLLGWNRLNSTLKAFDVANGTCVGDHKTPYGELETAVFLPDNRSVSVKKTDGKPDDVWKVP